MKAEIKIYIFCSNCGQGMQEKEYKELEKDKDGAQVLVDKAAITLIAYEITPEQLEGQTIAEFISGRKCRKCKKKTLKELIK